jgi:hypothetical protein
MLDDIRTAIRYVLGSPGLRAMILLSLAANLLIVGPFEVGVAVVAYTRLAEGAAAYGVLMSAFGGGSLLGLVVASALPAPRPSRFAYVVIGAITFAGVGLIGLPFVASTAVAAGLIAVSGFALGFGNLHGMTWVQSRVRPDLMGRVMSVMIMGSVGLVPVSMLVAGGAVQVSLDAMFIIAGVGMAIVCLGSLLSPAVRHLGLEPPFQVPEPADLEASKGATAEPAQA